MSPLWLGLALLTVQGQPSDTVRLPELHRAAVSLDPRFRQLALQDSASLLRMRNLAAERLPTVRVAAQASYQSEVAAVPIDAPGIEIPVPPDNRYEAALDVEQSLYDGGDVSRRRAAELARLRSERARIAAELHPLREEVNQAFFRAVLQQHRIEEITLLGADLEARLDVVRDRVREGAALPGDTAEIRAEVLRAAQSRAEAVADREAALAILSDLTGLALTSEAVLELPHFPTLPSDNAEQAAMGASPHPRYALFEAERNRLERQADVLATTVLPRVSVFGQWAYGSPGPRQFLDDPHDYWMAGLRFRWEPWNWRSTRRERELIRVEREVVNSEEAAFSAGLRRRVQNDLADIQRLRTALTMDDDIVVLRQQLERRAAAQLAERVITPADYVEARGALQAARLERSRHTVELAQAHARYLTALGFDIP